MKRFIRMSVLCAVAVSLAVWAIGAPLSGQAMARPSDEDLKLIEERAKNLKSFGIGYPVAQDAPLAGFYEWLISSGVAGTMLNNVGDPFNSNIKMGTHEIERRVIETFAPFYGFKPEEVWGIVTMSGTDGNDHGIYFGRKALMSQAKGKGEPILYVSKESHYSNKRLADLQQIETRLIDVDDMGRMIPSAFREALDPKRPALVVFSMGTTFKGAIDDMKTINAILKEAAPPAVYRHVDAALFGGYLPFTEHAYLVNAKEQGFDSIAVSGHKFFGIDDPCGLFVTTKAVLDMQSSFATEYLNGAMPMINCSRSAYAPLKLWWVYTETGFDGYAQRAAKMLDLAKYLKEKLDGIGWPAWREEMSNTVFFKRPEKHAMDCFCLAGEHDDRFGGDLAHVVVMPQVGHGVIDLFIEELKAEQGK